MGAIGTFPFAPFGAKRNVPIAPIAPKRKDEKNEGWN